MCTVIRRFLPCTFWRLVPSTVIFAEYEVFWARICTLKCPSLNTATALQGAKLQYGHVPIGARGHDEGGRQFGSLHAVQRHMVDRNQCKLAWEDNEEEYEDFYDWGDDDADSPEGATCVVAPYDWQCKSLNARSIEEPADSTSAVRLLCKCSKAQ